MSPASPISSRNRHRGPPADLALPLPLLDPESGLWSHSRQLASPHCDTRPEGETPSLIVIHNISLPPQQYGGGFIDALFLGQLDPAQHPYFEQIKTLRVSAHACVFRSGEVTQYVPAHLRAWHAGESAFDGRQRCNDFSIGIELEGSDFEPFTDAQYPALARLVVAAMRAYPGITAERITGHSDIAPGRKTDPGPFFDWQRLFAQMDFLR